MTLYTGLDLLNGDGLRADMALRIEGGQITEIRSRVPEDTGEDLSQDATRALICPGFIDLQVNGGGGLMLGDCHSVDDVARITEAHGKSGTLGLLPTLISDTPETVARIIDLIAEAARSTPAVLGLHLEGPHLAVPGAHDPANLRPMTDANLGLYLEAAQRLPHLMITLAPEQVTAPQFRALTEAGVFVSLGHSACDYDTACAAFAAGARGATHLFNAMSGLHHRAPGLVGAALDHAEFIGLIADGIHVHPAALRLAAKARPDALYLISDAMAPAGTDAKSFRLGNREIARANTRLTLADGTLAGADITQAEAIRVYRDATGVSLHVALSAAFDTPHRAMTGQPYRLVEGQPARLLLIRDQILTARHTGTGWSPLPAPLHLGQKTPAHRPIGGYSAERGGSDS